MVKYSYLIFFFQLNKEMSAFQRKFVSEVRRCEEMERRLRYVGSEVKKESVPVPELTVMPVAPNPREIIDLEVATRQSNISNGKVFRSLVSESF